jgi:ribosomal protein S18 acetylase RimI-like enzyme
MVDVSYKPITDLDRDFLHTVYASTRVEELKLTDWNEAQKSTFIDMQFAAQHRYYQEHYHDTDFLVISRDGKAVGRLYIARWPDEIRVVDLAILPEYRNDGIGTHILKSILEEAGAALKPVSIHVERYNPAQNLYRRLGFIKTGEHGVYDLLEWTKTA